MENNMQQKFIESVEWNYLADMGDLCWLSDVLSTLPNCYAKGYIEARLESLLSDVDDSYVVKISLLEWAKYDIWK